MPVLNDDDSNSRQGCSCLPFCFWGASSGGSGGPKRSGGARVKRRWRRRLRLRLRLRLSWLTTWPWFRKSGRKGDAGGDDGDSGSKKGKKKKQQQRRRLLLLLTTSLQPRKALASVVSGSGDGALLPVPAAKASSFGDAKKQSNRRPPRPTADAAASSSRRQPQASTTAATASTGWTTATARSRPETTQTSQPSPGPLDKPAVTARRIWRAPSRRHSLHQPDCSSSGLWTAATTLGVVVLFGRVTAVVFLCSCLYGARFVRAWAAGAGAKPQSSGVAGVSSSSRRFGDAVGVASDKVVAKLCTAEECKKKVVMAGLLDRAGRTTSSRFGR